MRDVSNLFTSCGFSARRARAQLQLLSWCRVVLDFLESTTANRCWTGSSAMSRRSGCLQVSTHFFFDLGNCRDRVADAIHLQLNRELHLSLRACQKHKSGDIGPYGWTQHYIAFHGLMLTTEMNCNREWARGETMLRLRAPVPPPALSHKDITR
ncbi:unnamed protein product [Peronospora effusa]|nr:unnamed protein product [Peronospora effusa]